MAIFRWPRGGLAKAFISLTSIYERLGFCQYSGRPWRWVHAGRPVWLKYFTEHGCSEHLELSTQIGKGKDDLDSAKGLLPFNAVSVWGALLLASRWAFHGERFGGMRDPDTAALACSSCMPCCASSLGEVSSSWSSRLCRSGCTGGRGQAPAAIA